MCAIRYLLARNPLWQESKVLIVDNTRYKNLLNHDTTMICPPTFEHTDANQDTKYLTQTLLSWLKAWNVAADPDAYVADHMITNDNVMAFSTLKEK